MEAVVKELRKDAQLGVFLRSDCDVSAIASEIVAKDSAATTSASAEKARQRSLSVSLNDASGDGGVKSSHSEHFIQRIDDAVRQIDRVITDHVSENHSALLARVGSVDGLQDDVAAIQSSVHHVKRAVDELEATVRQHHDKLASDIHKHRNVEQCGELVRKLLRFHQLSERVLAAFTNGAAPSKHHHQSALNTSEMVSTAVAIREIETLTADEQFEDLSIVRQTTPAIRRIATSIRRDVRNHLKSSIQSLSQADVGDALQILFYLGSLSDTVQTAVNDVIQDVERKCSSAIAEEMLVSRSASGPPNSNGGSGVNDAITVQKADVWKAIHDVFDCLRSHALQVWNLQRVLAKMVDATTGKSYLDLVVGDDEPTLFATFWEVSSAIVRELFSATLAYRAAVKMVLIASYPRMRDEAHRVLQELHAATSLKGDDTSLGDGSTDGLLLHRKDALQAIGHSRAERNQLLDAMAPLGEAFMERSLRRISNPIQMMFPQSSNFHTSPPSRSDMQTLARTVYAEVDQVGRDPVLLEQIVQQFRKSVNLFNGNAKKIMNTGRAAAATTPSCGRTAAQAHNVALLNALQQLDEMVGEVESRLHATATTAVTANTSSDVSLLFPSGGSLLKHVKSLSENELAPCHAQTHELQYTILGQYLQALAAILEGVFARMHDESFADIPKSANGRAAPLTPSLTGGSKYMTDFNAAFGIIVDDHLRRLPSAPCVTASVRDFIARLMSVFIRHASLLRPLQENGKLRLANDMAQLELHLESVVPLRTVGACYEELRAFRHMMFLDSNSIVRDRMVDKIRPSTVWHHLISRAPIELQLPHQLKRWTTAKYVEWLNTSACTSSVESTTFTYASLPLGHPGLKDPKLAIAAEKEAWKEVGKCLDAYAQRVSAVPGAELSPIYELLQDSGSILLAGYELERPAE